MLMWTASSLASYRRRSLTHAQWLAQAGPQRVVAAAIGRQGSSEARGHSRERQRLHEPRVLQCEVVAQRAAQRPPQQVHLPLLLPLAPEGMSDDRRCVLAIQLRGVRARRHLRSAVRSVVEVERAVALPLVVPEQWPVQVARAVGARQQHEILAAAPGLDAAAALELVVHVERWGKAGYRDASLRSNACHGCSVVADGCDAATAWDGRARPPQQCGVVARLQKQHSRAEDGDHHCRQCNQARVGQHGGARFGLAAADAQL
jgi:hypothetical protein